MPTYIPSEFIINSCRTKRLSSGAHLRDRSLSNFMSRSSVNISTSWLGSTTCISIVLNDTWLSINSNEVLISSSSRPATNMCSSSISQDMISITRVRMLCRSPSALGNSSMPSNQMDRVEALDDDLEKLHKLSCCRLLLAMVCSFKCRLQLGGVSSQWLQISFTREYKRYSRDCLSTSPKVKYQYGTTAFELPS